MLDVEYAARWSGLYGTGYSTFYKYNITNSGEEVAREIRISAKDVVALQFSRNDAKFADQRKSDDGNFYNLPDLNPSESVSVLIWSDDWHSDLSYLSGEDLPQVSYSGPRVDFRLYRPVTGIWYTLYDVHQDMPIWLSIPFFIAICFVICLSVIFIFAMLDAIINGKPLSSIFKTAVEDAEAAGAAP